MINFRVTGENIYFRPTIEADMATIATAVTGAKMGVWGRDQLPSVNEQKNMWWYWNQQNEELFGKRNLQLGDHVQLTLTICKKSDDSVVGYTHQKIHGKIVSFKMVGIIPSERRNGYYKEANILRHRMAFDGMGATKTTVVIPTTDAPPFATAVRGMLDNLYNVRNTKVQEIEGRGVYRGTIITAAEWNTWLDHSDQASLKAHAYSLTWASS